MFLRTDKGMVHNCGNTFEYDICCSMENPPSPLELSEKLKGAGGIFSHIQKVLLQLYWKMNHPRKCYIIGRIHH